MMEETTKKDVLNRLSLVKTALNDIENYIKDKVHENGEVIEKSIIGVLDYMYIILKELIINPPISYGVILEDAKKKGLEKEFRVAYRVLKSAKFIDYDVNNKFIIVGKRLKNLIDQYNNFKYDQKEKNATNTSNDNKKENINQNKTNNVNVSTVNNPNISIINEIYHWILNEINRNEWIEIDTIKGMFKGHEKEITEAINRIISEGKGILANNKIYKKE